MALRQFSSAVLLSLACSRELIRQGSDLCSNELRRCSRLRLKRRTGDGFVPAPASRRFSGS